MKEVNHKNTDTVLFHVQEVPGVAEFIETGNGMAIAKDG